MPDLTLLSIVAFITAGHFGCMWITRMINDRGDDILSGLLPYLPLPAKLTFRVGTPIRLPRDPELAQDRNYVREIYEKITSTMQAMVDHLAAQRLTPVLGSPLSSP
jgi:hypothetical protein